MAVSIRLATESDAADIAALTVQLGYDVDVSVLKARLSRILTRTDHCFLIAELEGRAVGWLHALILEPVETDPSVVIGGLVVDRSHRRQGIGRMLMERAERWAAEQGCSVVRLWSSSGRLQAHRFYSRLGYMNIKAQYAFAKSLDPAGRSGLNRLVPQLNG